MSEPARPHSVRAQGTIRAVTAIMVVAVTNLGLGWLGLWPISSFLGMLQNAAAPALGLGHPSAEYARESDLYTLFGLAAGLFVTVAFVGCNLVVLAITGVRDRRPYWGVAALASIALPALAFCFNR